MRLTNVFCGFGLNLKSAIPRVCTDSATIPGTQYLTITNRQNPTLTGITITVETSSDLKTWTAADPAQVLVKQLNPNPTGGQDLMMERGVPMIPGVLKQFIRLRVTSAN